MGRCSGIYNVVVTDAQGCSLTETVVIDEPDPIEVSLDPLFMVLMQWK